VTTAGTTSERLLRKMNEDNNMKMKIISAKDHGEAFLTLESGRATAFVMDEVLLYGERQSQEHREWAVVGTPQSYEAYGCMMRKDDPGVQEGRRCALAKVMTSGEAEKIYARWFLQPIPPKGLNLNFAALVRAQEAVQVAQRQGLRLCVTLPRSSFFSSLRPREAMKTASQRFFFVASMIPSYADAGLVISPVYSTPAAAAAWAISSRYFSPVTRAKRSSVFTTSFSIRSPSP
jgi:hypothetical protein